MIAFNVVTMGLALGVTPILLRTLGAARYGAARAVIDVMGYLTLFELGLSGAVIPLLARALAHDDRPRVGATLAAAFRAYLLVLVPMLLGAVVITLFIPRLVKVEPALHHELRLACIYAAIPVLLIPLTPLRSLLDASQRTYILSAFVIAQSVLIAVSSVLFAKCGFGIAGQTLAVAVGAILYGALVLLDAYKSARGLLPPHPFRSNAELSREIWSLNTPTLIINISARIGLFTDNVVIGSILSAPVIVPFLMTQRLGQIVGSQLQAVGATSWAGLTQLYTRGERELFCERFLELNQLVMALGLCALVPIVAFNHTFVALWLGESSYGGLALTAIAAGNALLLAIVSLWGWLFGGTGQLGRLVRLSVVSAAVNLLVSVGFTWGMSKRDPHDALWGPLLGTATALLLVHFPFTPILMHRHFQIPIGRLARTLTKPLLIVGPFAVGLLWLGARWPPRGWLALAASMAGAGAALALLCWILVLRVSDRTLWLSRLRLVLRR
ncbi:MAG TPA: oligosaccharide flippase family protein [Polyangiaceae bacterium]